MELAEGGSEERDGVGDVFGKGARVGRGHRLGAGRRGGDETTTERELDDATDGIGHLFPLGSTTLQHETAVYPSTVIVGPASPPRWSLC